MNARPIPPRPSTDPLEPKEAEDVHWPSTPPKDPHHALNNPVDEPDPTADSDPYERDSSEDPHNP